MDYKANLENTNYILIKHFAITATIFVPTVCLLLITRIVTSLIKTWAFRDFCRPKRVKKGVWSLLSSFGERVDCFGIPCFCIQIKSIYMRETRISIGWSNQILFNSLACYFNGFIPLKIQMTLCAYTIKVVNIRHCWSIQMFYNQN